MLDQNWSGLWEWEGISPRFSALTTCYTSLIRFISAGLFISYFRFYDSKQSVVTKTLIFTYQSKIRCANTPNTVLLSQDVRTTLQRPCTQLLVCTSQSRGHIRYPPWWNIFQRRHHSVTTCDVIRCANPGKPTECWGIGWRRDWRIQELSRCFFDKLPRCYG